MRGIISGQYKLYQQCTLWQFSGVHIHQTRSCKVWTQHTSLRYSRDNKSSQPALTKSLNLVQPIFSICLRHKSKRNSIPSEEDYDIDDSSVTLEKGPDFKDLQCKIGSLRIGSLAKVGFNISRTHAEKEFYSNKFRINGKKVDKKSANLTTGDVLDYIRQNSVPESPDLVEVSRVELRDVGGFDDGSSDLTVVIRRFPKLLLLREDFD